MSTMPLPAVDVRFGRLQATVRALCGRDEMAMAGEDTGAALRLLDNLVAWPEGQAQDLTPPERDRLLAEVWRCTFGPRIRGSARCSSCGEAFDMAFSLDELERSTWPGPPPAMVRVDERLWRIPTGRDELAVRGLDGREAVLALARHCAEAGAPVDEAAATAFDEALQAQVPVLDQDLQAECPECGAANTLAFRLQAWLLHRLAAERRHLPAQVHALARAYGWSLSEILALPRELRLRFVDLIDAESSGWGSA